MSVIMTDRVNELILSGQLPERRACAGNDLISLLTKFSDRFFLNSSVPSRIWFCFSQNSNLEIGRVAQIFYGDISFDHLSFAY